MKAKAAVCFKAVVLFIVDLLFIVDPSEVTKCKFVQLNFQQISSLILV